MASNNLETPGSPSNVASVLNFAGRRGSVSSISATSHVDKEQLAQTLNKIHNTASQSEALTTFNDFSPSQGTLPASENKGIAGDLVQHGFSGLYNRLREAVGGTATKAQDMEASSGLDTGSSKRSSNATVGAKLSSKPSVASMPRGDAAATSSTFNSGLNSEGQSSTVASSGVNTTLSDNQFNQQQSSKATTASAMTGSKSTGSSRQTLPPVTKATTVTALNPEITPAVAHRDSSQSVPRTDESTIRSTARRSMNKSDVQHLVSTPENSDLYEKQDLSINTDRSKSASRTKRDDGLSVDGSADSPLSPAKSNAPSLSTQHTELRHARTPSGGSSLLAPRRPAVIERIRTSSPGYAHSRSSSQDQGTAEASPISTSAHNSVYHESFNHESQPQQGRAGALRIPGTTGNEGLAAEEANTRLETLRKQVLSKEFWMADETCKECFSCGQPFSAFRRKHHCRVCGFIFDSKCTSIVPAQKFGMSGTVRCCNRCLKVLNNPGDGSDSDDDSEDESYLPAIFRPNQAKAAAKMIDNAGPGADDPGFAGKMEDVDDTRSISTPMMAIPATRRIDDSNRKSAILEIDAPQLSRPSSSRSLKSLATNRPQSSGLGHKRQHSRQNFWSRFKPVPDDSAPFRRDISEEMARKPKYPAFHEDNIIDPELAAYMSDESSGDEQMSIFATMGNSDLQPSSFDREKSNFGPFLGGPRKHRFRGGEKSISGLSFTSRGLDDNPPGTMASHGRPPRRRNLSNVSASVHHLRSPRPRSSTFKGPSASHENILADIPAVEATKLIRSDSMQEDHKPQIELNSSSMLHVKKLLQQLLEDSSIPNAPAWEKALIPILLQCTDDVVPDIRAGDDMDIRHYVKIKKIPGGKPGDTAYVSGVIFTKNLALKSMPRRIVNPRIVIVSFPIEYQRHQQHFMSLQPVIEQEKEFLRVVVNRIINLRPQVLLCEKSISGTALQYLSEANIAVAYNVKPSVISAVSRCAEADIITSLDRLALQNQVGRAAGFEVKTYVNKNYPGKKKTYIFLSGCAEQLGCTVALRGDSTEVLSRMKTITEFMVYVVYNLKLETCLMRDEFIQLPADSEAVSLSSSIRHQPGESFRSQSTSGETGHAEALQSQEAPAETEIPSQASIDPSLSEAVGTLEQVDESVQPPAELERSRTVSLHASHASTAEAHVPEDVPMPTYYSDVVARYETKILSASPFVKFAQPYLLMKAREQERRLVYLKRLRDQDVVEEQVDPEKRSQRFQLIKPEMVHELGQKAPRQIMEVLHAVHDAEYDKALHSYQTQTRQWENYIQGNLNLFDPYSHQNIVVLYSVICTESKIPCAEPGLVAISFYDEHGDTSGSMDPDCTLGQYIEDLCLSKESICTSNGCDRKMTEHHRTYVHDEARITVFVEPAAVKPKYSTDDITMWSYCKVCKKDSPMMPMSDSTWKYSFGKYLELLFWSKGLKLHENTECDHDHHRDHIRLFQFRDTWIRIHYDPIDLLEIIVPRARITWKVDNDLKLKNEIFSKIESRWIRFMTSVKVRIKSIRIDSVLPEKADACKAEVERLTKKANDDQVSLIRKLQETYVNSKYYEVIPFNAIIREMLEWAGEWDAVFNQFEADFLPDKDLRQLTMIQLKKIFSDNESKESLPATEGSTSTIDTGEPPSQTFSETDEKMSTQPTDMSEPTSALEQSGFARTGEAEAKGDEDRVSVPAEGALERVEPLDLATSSPPSARSQLHPGKQDTMGSPKTASTKDVELAGSPTPLPTSSADDGGGLGDFSLSEKVEQLRREHRSREGESSSFSSGEQATEPPRPIPTRGPSRKAGLTVSPPLVRAASQPIRTLKGLTSPSKVAPSKGTKTVPEEVGDTTSDGTIKVDKKFSERLGFGGSKAHKKATTPSSIPRPVHKKKESKVFAITKHFEQLTREFEKERIREHKKKRLAQQPRAFLPRTSTKAIVEVYDDVNDAVQEPEPTDEEPLLDQRGNTVAPPALKTSKTAPVSSTNEDEQHSSMESSKETVPEPTDMQTSGDTDEPGTATASHGGSDDEGGGSDNERALEDILPDVQDLADALEPSTEIPLELPKHQKKSLMKLLTNFWAERSASGWPLLDYPVNPSDHIFIDSDVIVREDEPSSVIAFALSSDDYRSKLADIRRSWQIAIQKNYEAGNADSKSSAGVSDTGGEFIVDEGELEKSLLRATGTHLKYQFREGSATMLCKIFYAEQFDALRRKCGVADRIIESLSRCLKWDSKGGKTKSVFLKTLDDRLVLKALSPVETSAFLRFAPAYFGIMAEALFHDLPSVIAKMLGFFQLIIKNPVTGVEMKLDLLLMENLFYDRSPSRIFDLKGSMRNRKIQSTGEQNEVLLDENMVEFIYESPLFAREHSKKLLRASVWNDTLFLARQNVMDYSLMIAVDEGRRELVVGIIDCIRTYTWDKTLESWIKGRGFAGGGRNRPTVTSPKEYKSRFREAMARYILQAPNCWHQFGAPHLLDLARPRAEDGLGHHGHHLE